MRLVGLSRRDGTAAGTVPAGEESELFRWRRECDTHSEDPGRANREKAIWSPRLVVEVDRKRPNGLTRSTSASSCLARSAKRAAGDVVSRTKGPTGSTLVRLTLTDQLDARGVGRLRPARLPVRSCSLRRREAAVHTGYGSVRSLARGCCRAGISSTSASLPPPSPAHRRRIAMAFLTRARRRSAVAGELVPAVRLRSMCHRAALCEAGPAPSRRRALDMRTRREQRSGVGVQPLSASSVKLSHPV